MDFIRNECFIYLSNHSPAIQLLENFVSPFQISLIGILIGFSFNPSYILF